MLRESIHVPYPNPDLRVMLLDEASNRHRACQAEGISNATSSAGADECYHDAWARWPLDIQTGAQTKVLRSRYAILRSSARKFIFLCSRSDEILSGEIELCTN